jgi:hypothetical protein
MIQLNVDPNANKGGNIGVGVQLFLFLRLCVHKVALLLL